MTDPTLIQALKTAAAYPHPAEEIKLIETHISWVFLTGEYAYKIKKPLNLGFLDFSTLEKRKYNCERELLLNRRLVPDIYIDVVPIGGVAEHPRFNATPAIEYTVKMRQFSPQDQLDALLARGELQREHMDELADTIAKFHQSIETAALDSHWGEPAQLWQAVAENFSQIRSLIDDTQDLNTLEQWSKSEFKRLEPFFIQRKKAGFVRNCHGDMHLANIALIDDRIAIFDCIEFNDAFRWIDVISEIAFTLMDLTDRNKADFAARLLDRYLQQTGDYQGLTLLPFYLVYRAMVRAKVAVIRGQQPGISAKEKTQAEKDYHDYTVLAQRFTQKRQPVLFITHGLSGSGKTTLSQPLLERFNLIRLRSDVERKRLFGFSAEEKTGSETEMGIYHSDASKRTYQHLLKTASLLCQNGFSVVVDATFLKRAQRRLFHQLANQLKTPFVILHFHADEPLLRQWIRARAEINKDASEATLDVLNWQIKTAEAAAENEADYIVSIDSASDEASKTLISTVQLIFDKQFVASPQQRQQNEKK